jgi:hypothetical protein
VAEKRAGYCVHARVKVEYYGSVKFRQRRNARDFVRLGSLATEFLAENRQPPASGEGGTLWDKIEKRIAQAPPETWEDTLPDGSLNVDHYLYGVPWR